MRKIFKKLVLPLNLVLIIMLCFYAFMYAIKKARNYEIYTKPEIETKIYTVWHIETFEGGGKARIDYLKTIARQIEKETDGVLIMVKALKPEMLESSLENEKPDVVSFGYGVGKILLPNLITLNSTYNVRDEMVESGKFNNKIYALPYIVSGYAMITHGSLTNNFHCGQNEYIKPNNIYNQLNLTPQETESQYEAYKDFVYNKKVTLLGSGRDVYRVNNLNSIGRTTAIITPNDSYTDLLQYLGLFKNDEITNKFLNLALDDEHQNSLANYSLYSSKHLNLYTEGVFKEMEETLKKCRVAGAFSD